MSNILIAGGGTGGHVYPAVAIADAIVKMDPKIRIHFVGSKKGLENKIVPEAGYPLHLVPIGRLNRNVGLWEQLKTIVGLPASFILSTFLLLKLRPQFVIGVGGYASAPVLFVASLFGFKTAIWEPNAYPGMANRWLSRFVDESLVVFQEAKRFLRTTKNIPVGLPIREKIEKVLPKSQVSQPLRVLVFGGSQGARGINLVVSAVIEKKPSWLAQLEIVHQTGKYDFEEVRQKYKDAPKNVQVFEYLDDMEARYEWADLVLCRSGASTLSELAACAKPSVLIPYPLAADNHQQKNAEAFEQKKASIMVEQKNFTEQKLEQILMHYLRHPDELLNMGQNARYFYVPQAADQIASHILEAQR